MSKDNSRVPVPAVVWHEVRRFFAALVSPCKECVRGNPESCVEPRCPVFKYRDIAALVLSAAASLRTPPPPLPEPKAVAVENEILALLKHYGKPVYPSMLVLQSTHSRANKRNAINRLVMRGLVVEERVNPYTRILSLPHLPTATNNNH